MSAGHQWNDDWQGKPEYSVKPLSHCHFISHEFYMDYSGIEPNLYSKKIVANHLHYGTIIQWINLTSFSCTEMILLFIG